MLAVSEHPRAPETPQQRRRKSPKTKTQLLDEMDELKTEIARLKAGTTGRAEEAGDGLAQFRSVESEET